MNGWIRLWIFLTIIWGLVVGSVATFVVIEDTPVDESGPWVKYRLTEKSKKYYEDLKAEETGPVYTVAISLESGEKVRIRFDTLFDEIDEELFRNKLGKMAASKNTKVSDTQVDLFIDNLKRENSAALSAKKEYVLILAKARKENQEKRVSTIKHASAIFIAPSALILLLGCGVAWVRRGFKSNA